MSVVDISKMTFDNAEVVPSGAGIPSERNLDVVAFEINIIKEQTAGVIARSIFEIGKRLCEAKALIGHGNWEAWLRDNVAYSESNARNLMRAYREMGGEQIDMLTGEAPCDVFESLNLSQMVALFPLPAHERAAFVKEHDVKDKSVRDIEALVAEATAKGREEGAKEIYHKYTEEQARANELEDRLEASVQASENWEKIAAAAEKVLAEDKIKHEAEIRRLQEKEQKLKDKIAALENAPVQEKIVYVEKEPSPSPSAPPFPEGEALTVAEEDTEARERVEKMTEELALVREQLAAAEKRAEAMAQKADVHVQAVNFAIREIAEKVSAISDAIDEIRGGTTGNGELADKLSTSASKAIKAVLEGAEWYA